MSVLKVASILDEFSFMCFKYECNLIPLTADGWKDTLIREKPDLLLVESAWNREYKKLIKYQAKNKSENIVNWCKTRKIPTVFWNKEDPYHYNFFLEEARKFDYIFSTDLNCIPQYKAGIGNRQVYLLPFAAQPQIHNPIDKDLEKLGIVAFSGTWYQKRQERKEDMQMLLEPALKYGIHIYDRNYRCKNTDIYLFPEVYQPYIKGGLNYEQMVQTYKKYDIFMNVNTVKNSPTMFSRRVFEVLACGVNVISNYSLGIERMLPDIVKLCKTKSDTVKHLTSLINNKARRDRLSLLGQREIFNKHTYGHRMETILDKIKYRHQKTEAPGISVITWIDNLERLDIVLANFERQSYPRKELILILLQPNTGLGKWIETEHARRSEKTGQYDHIRVFKFSKKESIQELIDFGADRANYDYLTWFDTENYYAAEFLGDLMNAFKYANAAVVGKCSHYAYAPENGSLEIVLPDMEYRYTDLLVGTAMIAKREILDKIKFLSATDIKNVVCKIDGNDGKIYATDRFNFISHIPLEGTIDTKRACI